MAVALFAAPAALHRMLFRSAAKPEVLSASSQLAAVGLSVLILALTGSVLLVVDVVLGRLQGALAGGATLLECVGLWGLLPEVGRCHAARAGARAGRWAPGGPQGMGAEPHA